MIRLLPCIFVGSVYLLLLSSCHGTKLVQSPPSIDPYVRLKTGKRISVKSISVTPHMFKPTDIETDNGRYTSRNVSFFSNGSVTYANSAKGFAKQYQYGKINVFGVTKTFASATGDRGGSYRLYFIQPSGANYVRRLTYNRLMSEIPPGNAARKGMWSYPVVSTIANTTMYAAVAMFAAGVFNLARYLPSQDSEHVKGDMEAGLGLCVGGIALYFPSYIIRSGNRNRLYNAAYKYNNSMDGYRR